MEITLKSGHVVFVDDADFSTVSIYSWRVQKKDRGSEKGVIEGVRTEIRIAGETKRRSVLIHRFLLNPQNNMKVDHIDGDVLNNRRYNLRICTDQQNLRNSKKKNTNTSGFKGVSWDKRAKKWMAGICLNGKTIYLGLHLTPQLAHEAYKQKAVELFGEFARFE